MNYRARVDVGAKRGEEFTYDSREAAINGMIEIAKPSLMAVLTHEYRRSRPTDEDMDWLVSRRIDGDGGIKSQLRDNNTVDYSEYGSKFHFTITEIENRVRCIADQTEALQLGASIIEVFEDFLDEKGIVIENPEKADSKDDCASNIYGTDFGTLYQGIMSILKSEGFVAEEIY